MMKMLLKPTPTMLHDSRVANILYTIVAVLAAVAMFLCATGSGNQTTAEPWACRWWCCGITART